MRSLCAQCGQDTGGTLDRRLTKENVDSVISDYLSSIESIGDTITNLKGLSLFQSLKRDPIGVGPYSGVTLFEAANRIMTDLVILHGVKWLLKTRAFPFDEYVVEYGNEDTNDYDITAESEGEKLTGEAFNVAQSFFQVKKASMLKKLRKAGNKSDYKVIMVNTDSVKDGYSPRVRTGEYYIFVNVESGEARLLPNKANSADARTSRG